MGGTTKKFWKRLRRLWFLHLAEPYATGVAIACFVGASVLVAIRFNIDWLATLATSVLDIKPVLLFLLSWCAVRFFQLLARALFPRTKTNFRLANRFRKAMADGAMIYLAAACGTVYGLWLSAGDKQRSHLDMVVLLSIVALAYPFLIALGFLSNRSSGMSRDSVGWIKLAAGGLFVMWMLMVG